VGKFEGKHSLAQLEPRAAGRCAGQVIVLGRGAGPITVTQLPRAGQPASRGCARLANNFDCRTKKTEVRRSGCAWRDGREYAYATGPGAVPGHVGLQLGRRGLPGLAGGRGGVLASNALTALWTNFRSTCIDYDF
jgi:hypothetical protein